MEYSDEEEEPQQEDLERFKTADEYEEFQRSMDPYYTSTESMEYRYVPQSLAKASILDADQVRSLVKALKKPADDWLVKVGAPFTPFIEKHQHANAFYRVYNKALRAATAAAPTTWEESLECEFPELAKEWAQSRMGFLTPCQVRSRSTLYAWWSCASHGDWAARIDNRTAPNSKGSNCPKCSQSKLEKLMEAALKKLGLQYEPEKKFADCLGLKGGLARFDFYLSNEKLAVELDGIQHFHSVSIFGGDDALVERRVADGMKTAYCAAKGITLLRIPYCIDLSEDVMTHWLRHALSQPPGTFVTSHLDMYQ
jgi:very-short-patch-repair endonuclease